MPHLIVEFPQDMAAVERIEQMLDAVHETAVATGLFEESHIRIRAIPFSHYRVGGRHETFIHVQCRIHSGRDETQKRKLSDAVLAAIRAQRFPVKSITVEVVDMTRAAYARHMN